VLGPIMTASADEPDALPIADDHHPVAVEFEFVDPSGPVGTLSALVGSENGYSIC
jgi:hypothetical protein